LTEQSSEDILELLIASDELLIDELFDYVQDYLIEKQIEWILKKFSLVLHISFKLSNCKKLQEYCLKIICEDTHSFITSNEFLSLDKEIIYKVLEKDDSQIKEVDVWDHLIKWSIEQTPGDNEDYEALKKTLNEFIPLVRFVDITFNDFNDKI
jgi:hypothetical protein